MRDRVLGLIPQAIDHATNPASPDYLGFTHGQQCLVDTAFLAQAIVCAPKVLWTTLPTAYATLTKLPRRSG
jgi:hypothetical protein